MICQYQGRRSGEGQPDHRKIGVCFFGHAEPNNAVRYPHGNPFALSLSF